LQAKRAVGYRTRASSTKSSTPWARSGTSKAGSSCRGAAPADGRVPWPTTRSGLPRPDPASPHDRASLGLAVASVRRCAAWRTEGWWSGLAQIRRADGRRCSSAPPLVARMFASMSTIVEVRARARPWLRRPWSGAVRQRVFGSSRRKPCPTCYRCFRRRCLWTSLPRWRCHDYLALPLGHKVPPDENIVLVVPDRRRRCR
jgi:hypothetical protein